jgi:hypothetical protein
MQTTGHPRDRNDLEPPRWAISAGHGSQGRPPVLHDASMAEHVALDGTSERPGLAALLGEGRGRTRRLPPGAGGNLRRAAQRADAIPGIPIPAADTIPGTVYTIRSALAHQRKVNCPQNWDQLLQQAALLVRDGWAANIDEILSDALRRYLDSHSAALSEAFIREDLDWGLRGRD